MEEKLGRGLAALLGEQNGNDGVVNKIDIKLLIPNKNQPRKIFDENKISELAGSIATHGILQPIVVREKKNENGETIYEIIAGERRWRAAESIGMQHVPVHIVNCKDSDILALSLIENIQRSDLNPIEEAEAIQTLMTDCACTQEEVGALLGKSRSYITNALRLLLLQEDVRNLVANGELSVGHAKCLIGTANASEMARLAIRRAMNVRQLENMLKIQRRNTAAGAPRSGEAQSTEIERSVDHESEDIANRFSEALRVEAKLKITRRGGVFTLVCKSCEELERLTGKLLSLGDIESGYEVEETCSATVI